MPQVIYRDGRGPAQRIQDRLKPSSASGLVKAQGQTETQPTRTVTTVHYGGAQQGGPGAMKGDYDDV